MGTLVFGARYDAMSVLCISDTKAVGWEILHVLHIHVERLISKTETKEKTVWELEQYELFFLFS